MATPIPMFASQVILDNTTNAVKVTSGSTVEMAVSRYYYFRSNRQATSNGQDLLYAIAAALTSSLAGTTWVVTLSQATWGGYHVCLYHDNVASRTIDVSGTPLLWTNLGFASGNIVVAASTVVTAANPSVWMWDPNMPISMTGPTPWDPSISYGVPIAAGTAHQSPDGTTSYTANGVTYRADVMFNGAQFYYTIRPQTGYTNRSLETWWTNGPRRGRRCLMWRNRETAADDGGTTPAEGSASPYNYVEYAPTQELIAELPATPVQPELLTYWNVRLPFWLTENGETPLTD